LEQALKSAEKIIKKSANPEILLQINILEKLIEIYTVKKEYNKGIDYADYLYVKTKELARKNPTNPSILDKYSNVLIKISPLLSNAGQFRKIEEYYEDALGIFADPPFHYFFLDMLVNVLTQQGKTQIAITRLEQYRAKIAHSPNSWPTVRSIFMKIAYLHFNADNYNEALYNLQQALKLTEEKQLQTNLQLLCDLSNAYWELGNEQEARVIQSKIKNTPREILGISTPPCSVSKYLCTTECSLKQGLYNIGMRVNRERSNRKEGEPLEEPEAMKRKVDRCFLVIHFEGKDGRKITTSQAVTKPHQFIITSPVMDPHDSQWYEVVIDIYEDEKKLHKLGVHHQLIFASPSLGLRDSLPS